jgi:hypothetical protein
MGRELAMVPPNWDHPKTTRHWGEDDYQPMYRRSYEEEKREWIDGLLAWERGERPSYYARGGDDEYWEYAGNPPDKRYYAPFKEEECTWYQVWETVSEGTPVTPPFATKEELIDYLATHGDFWDQRRGNGPWSRAAATKFVMSDGWAPSMVIAGGVVYEAKDVSVLQTSQNVAENE